MNNDFYKPDDDLEDFFRNRLGEFKDEPPTDMWDRIESDIPPKPAGAPRTVFLWTARAAAVALILGLGLSNFWQKQEMVEMAEELQHSKQDIASLADRLDNAIAGNIPEGSQAVPASEEIGFPSVPVELEPNTPQLVANKAADAGGSVKNVFPVIPSSELETNFTVVEFVPPLKEQRTVVSGTMPVLETKEKNLNVKPTYSEIKGTASGLISQTSEFDKTLADIGPISGNGYFTPKGKGSWFIAANAGTEHWIKSKKAEEYRETEKSMLGYDGGVNIGYQLNDSWSLYTGVGYGENRLSIQKRGQLSYDQSLETLTEDGVAVSPYNIASETSAGDFEFATKMNRDEETLMASGEMLPLQTRMEYTRGVVEIPLGARYDKRLGKNWKVGARAGLVHRFKVREQVVLTDLESYKDGVSLSMPAKGKGVVTEGSSTYNLGYAVGVGASYRLTDNWSLTAEPVLEGTLSKPSTSRIDKNYPYVVGVEAGLTYHF